MSDRELPARARAYSGWKQAEGPLEAAFHRLRDIADLDEREDILLRHLVDVYNTALDRSYLNKAGELVSNPDCSTAAKVIETIHALVVAQNSGAPRAKVVDLAMFGSRKKATP